ncbi:MAG: hypothetical protein WCY66_09295 [Candidatus Cloacimonadales bacterium]
MYLDIKTLGLLLSSTVISSLVTAIYTKYRHDKTDKLRHITNERKRWRDDIRSATVHVVKKSFSPDENNIFSSMQEAKAFFQTRLNPYDKHDNLILECFDLQNDCVKNGFEEHIARLLKHDWERSKNEVKSKFFYKIYSWFITLLVFYELLFCINFDFKSIGYKCLAQQNENARLIVLILIIILPLCAFLVERTIILLVKKITRVL